MILPEKTLGLLDRNIRGFIQRREQLLKLGHLNEGAGCELTQFVAQQFSGRGLRQFVRKFDMSWVLVWRDSMFDELLQFAREIRSSCDAFPNDDEGFGSVEFRIFSISDHRRLQDAFVLNQGAFDFEW